MAFTTASKETAAIAAATTSPWVSLHTADPGTTGTSEASGGSPAYARKQTTFAGGASDGSTVGSQVTFDVPAGTYTWSGYWTASTGGTFLYGLQLSASAPFGAQGQLQVTPTVTAS